MDLLARPAPARPPKKQLCRLTASFVEQNGTNVLGSMPPQDGQEDDGHSSNSTRDLNSEVRLTAWQEMKTEADRLECFPESSLEVLSTSTSSVQTSSSSFDLSSTGSPVQTQFGSDASSDTGISIGSGSSVAVEEYEGEGETEDMSDVQSTSSFPWASSVPMPGHRLLSRHGSLTRSFRHRRVGTYSIPPQSASSASDDEECRDEQLAQLRDELEKAKLRVQGLEEEKNTIEEDRCRLRQNSTSAQKKIHAVEDQMREMELRHQEEVNRLRDRQRRKVAQVENHFSHRLDNLQAQLNDAEHTIEQLREGDAFLRQQIKSKQEELLTTKEHLSESQASLSHSKDRLSAMAAQQRRERDVASATIDKIQQQFEETAKHANYWQEQYEQLLKTHKEGRKSSYRDNAKRLEVELSQLNKTVTQLRDRNDDLSAQLVQQGKLLLDGGPAESIAVEMDTRTKDEVMTALTEEQSHSTRLKQYIDNLLAVILDQSPQILEVRSNSTAN